ncbi:hypothetical protein Esi_0005_0104 [Ectocarpus siliculosus]|uniref:Uncharacterized protein n=1 Tax=Ectocarpus siliculosus TaxID=2880 RepID=D8LNP9_ECTSI|nr:hypothetical protein Esi_0005_0104 [Ectocarpus siliculosus]|eukprot:CBN78259.1 hypothetical protein Esi_0005_0104 [Ectocarpus siliculosus]
MSCTPLYFQNEVYKNPDLWICLFVNYGCDEWELEKQCVHSAWMTEGGEPDAVFYPRVKLGQEQETTTEQLQIEAIPENTDFDSEGNYVEDGRGQCVVFKTSAATAFVGQERDPHEFLDYVHLDMYWYPGGEFGNSTTCVADGVEWADHR